MQPRCPDLLVIWGGGGLEGLRTAKRPTWAEAWEDLRNCYMKMAPSPPFAPVMRTMPIELAIVDVVRSTACKWMKSLGLIFSSNGGLISKSWRSISYTILKARDPI